MWTICFLVHLFVWSTIHKEFTKHITPASPSSFLFFFSQRLWQISGYIWYLYRAIICCLLGETCMSVSWGYIILSAYLTYSFRDGHQIMDHSWLPARGGNIPNQEFLVGATIYDWDSTLLRIPISMFLVCPVVVD